MQVHFCVLQCPQDALGPQMRFQFQGEGYKGAVEESDQSRQRQNSPNLIYYSLYIQSILHLIMKKPN